MSNYAREGVLNGEVIVGPETVNGTGQVYLNAEAVRFLSNEEARTLITALIEATDYAEKLQQEMEEWPLCSAPVSVRSYEWTDPQWRMAADPPAH